MEKKFNESDSTNDKLDVFEGKEIRNDKQEELAKRFARKLSRKIDEKNLTQQQLADIMGISRSSLSYYCSGKRIPRVGTIRQLAAILGVPESYFLLSGNSEEERYEERKEQEHIGDSELWKLIESLKNLTTEQVRTVRHNIEEIISDHEG